MLIAKVAFDHGFKKPLDYIVPEHLVALVAKGSFVEAPLRNDVRKGTVIELHKRAPSHPLKPIEKVLSSTSLLSEELFKLALWMSEYYCTPLPLVLSTMIPSSVRGKMKDKEQYFVRRGKTREEIISEIPAIRNRSPVQAELLEAMLKIEKGMFLSELLMVGGSKATVDSLVKKGLLEMEKVAVFRSPLKHEEYFPSKPKKLSTEQQEAFLKIVKGIKEETFSTHLLHGVTGSGKTEVYLQAIGEALALGKGAIVLVPEIALTAQTIERFRSRFEGHIAVLHHRLSDGERNDTWKQIRRGEAKIVIGARSALFSPVQNLGLIIVDEEHEPSYKQSDHMPCYHARDVAVMRGKICHATVLLASATPSLESFANCLAGKYTLSELKERPLGAHLPVVKIVDMRKEYEKKKGFTLFSEELLSGIEKRKSAGEQVILFLNRRGYHTAAICLKCGESVKCQACDIPLSFHKKDGCLSCHMCGYFIPMPRGCPSCKEEASLKFKGVGTEQVEAALYAIFNEIRVTRLDADTTKHKGSHEKLYRSFRSGKADVLIGTQMIAKGLHFPEVTLVGILNSDLSLNIPDFRAGENTFQLLTQVAGRAGRGVVPGEVLIQTLIPGHSVIELAAKQDVAGFVKEELEVRRAFQNPPFSILIKFRFTGEDLPAVEAAANGYRKELLALLPPLFELSIVDPSGHAKIKGQHRLQFIAKGPKITPLASAIRQLEQRPLPRGVRLLVDVNPTTTFF